MQPSVSLRAALAASAVAILPLGSAHAAVTFVTGSAVTTPDREATFDSLISNGISLTGYAEDSLAISGETTSYVYFNAFSPNNGRITGFYYGTSNSPYLSISTTDGADFTAIDLRAGNAYGLSQITLLWETYRDGELTGSGLSPVINNGTIAGWTDPEGIDELRVAAQWSTTTTTFNGEQALVLDDLRVELIPEPSAAALAVLGGCFLLRRKRA